MIKYVVYPGKMRSKHDRDIHYISAPVLMELYKVDPKECVVSHGDSRDLGKDFTGLIPLYPRYNGKYEVPDG